MSPSLSRFLLFAAAVISTLQLAVAGSRKCHDVGIQVSVQAKVANLPRHLSKDALLNYVGRDLENIINIPIKGTYTIRGTYCQSKVENKNNNRLLFLVHGVLGSRHEWTGEDGSGLKPYHGTNYSYVDYVTERGYDTLAIDRLGNGQSDHPNPVLNAQLPAQIETTKSVLDKVKEGRLGKKYKDIVYVGQSYGSILGHGIAAKYPNVLNAYILNGWSNKVTNSSVPTLYDLNLLPAKAVKPKQYGQLPAGYLTPSTPMGCKKLDYYNGGNGKYFDEGMAHRECSTAATASLGELFTSFLNPLPASGYNGHVLVITGQYDGFFCARDFLLDHGDCGLGSNSIPAKSKAAFPKADYAYHIPLNTGHAIQLHYTQKQSFAKSLSWIDQVL